MVNLKSWWQGGVGGDESARPIPNEEPLRGDLLSIDLLKQHARNLAQNRRAQSGRGQNLLLPRLAANEKILRDYNVRTLRVEKTRRITPAAEWLLDNYHLIEEQIHLAQRHLPRRFDRELPQLQDGPWREHPRVYEIAVELVTHTDGRIDAGHLTAFLNGYQESVPLKLGELWAVPIMLRLALIENLRRVAVMLSLARQDRDMAEDWADTIFKTAEKKPSDLIITVGEMARSKPVLSRAFVTEFLRRMQERPSPVKLAASWIEERLAEDGLTVAQLMQSESQHQAAMQVSVGNSISSLRFLDTMDWRDFVEDQSFVEKLLRTDAAGVYARMDFATRDLYRHSIERIARLSKKSEQEVASLAIGLAQKHTGQTDSRLTHVGFFLNGKGEKILERAAGAKISINSLPSQVARRFPLTFYLAGIWGLSLLVTLPAMNWLLHSGASGWRTCLMTLLLLICSSQLGVAVANWFATLYVKPSLLPRMDFSKGIPAEDSTLVVVPTMLTSYSGLEKLLEALEVRYLANNDSNVYFALLTDFSDSAVEIRAEDEELLKRAGEGISGLNQKYKADRPSIFSLLHRPRRWNEREKTWMGYERKRGKLADLNRCLRGGSRDCFSKIAGDLSTLPHIRYVITLDTDTQLPRDAARQLVATMAHPLNRPVYNAEKGLIVEGYSILQPRVAVSLPSAQRSRFVKLFSGDPGIDPYTRTVSDVYQDLFQEGSFIGKGIYDVDAFERAVGGKFPENRILSHDLLEGSYARAGLVSDVQLFEEYPAQYNADVRRRHRWMRGDWQIAAWLLPRLPGTEMNRVKNPLTGLSRWKIFDNLRRTLVPFALVFFLLVGDLLFPAQATAWALLLLGIIALPSVLGTLTELLQKPKDLPFRLHLNSVKKSALRQLAQIALALTFLPYDTVISLDAVVRTLYRLFLTRRHLLEWQTASDVDQQSKDGLPGYFWAMGSASLLALGMMSLMLFSGITGAAVTYGFLTLWILSPVIAWWISLPLAEKRAELNAGELRQLRQLARKTWYFFETFVSAADNWLPPDNFQEYPLPVVATRTSPTNIGLAMLSALGAHDLGYLTRTRLIENIGRTVGVSESLEKYNGHFYNWYDTHSRKPMAPPYVSTVDNGNLAALLLTLHTGLVNLADEVWEAGPVAAGLSDTLDVLREQKHDAVLEPVLAAMATLVDELKGEPAAVVRTLEKLIAAAGAGGAKSETNAEFETWRARLEQTCCDQRDEITAQFPWLHLDQSLQVHLKLETAHEMRKLWAELNTAPSLDRMAEELKNWQAVLMTLLERARAQAGCEELTAVLTQLGAALDQAGQYARTGMEELEDLARRCEDLARMDFTLLYDPTRELFSIGYNVAQHRLDPSYYDLLASESRLGSFVAVALGQVEQNHWFQLGRSLTTNGGTPTLISWSGSMFEYLMPMLIMPSYENTLLDYSCKSAVARQIEYGQQIHVPWGISESGYNVRDADANYQYRAFGVPGLGFKRGLAQDIVIAPYATVMALMVAPEEAIKNIRLLQHEEAGARFGLYEALDYTSSRVPNGQTHAVVRSFMVHHQGMSLLALVSVLLNRPMQRRFHDNPLFKSADLLLHERVPKETSVLFPHELEASREREPSAQAEATMRVFTEPNVGPPEVHLLSNGRYHVMITNSGGSYSRWMDTMVTRWREDATRDCWGTYIYLRDLANGDFWSAAHHPTLENKPGFEAVFSQGRAEFRSRFHDIDAHTEIAVSPEDDVEVRRLTLTNHSDEPRTIEVTTYAEIVLNTMAADLAHPAFSNLFVQTEVLPRLNAIICSRRPRASHEKPPLTGHLLLVHGQEIGSSSFETDRSKFIGRGGSLAQPAAFKNFSSRDDHQLSNTDGSVLDPVAAVRRTLRLEPKESATVTLVCGIAPTREAIVSLVEKYQDYSIANRCFELAWTQGLVALRQLNTTEPEAQLYGRVAGALLYSQSSHRAPATTLSRNQRGQRGLWSYGISGDLPIVLLHCTHSDGLKLIRQVIQAHAYWRLKGLASDLVILNNDNSLYRQPLNDDIRNLIATGNATQLIDKPGGFFLRQADQLTAEDKTLLESSARIVLYDDKGTLAEQWQQRQRADLMPPALRPRPRNIPETAEVPPLRDLIFFNGTGGFTRDGREYVICLAPGETTPAPWVNVLANPNFGTLLSESGGAYTWSENCHEFRLTPWNNDAVTDAAGEAFYIRDDQSGAFWSPTQLPVRSAKPYVIRHGFGYSVFEHQEAGVFSELTIYVSANEPVKFAVFKLRNDSDRRRQLSVTGYWEWVLGELRNKGVMHVTSEIDSLTNALFARNPYNTDFEGRVAFVACSDPARSVTASRLEFLGRNGTLAQPAALGRMRLSGKTGVGLGPCAAMQIKVELEPGAEREISFIIGAGKNPEQARDLAQRLQNLPAAREELLKVQGFWRHTLDAVRVETPEPALDVLVNGWLLYQTICCRLWARTGFYQSGGAFGFRDQLQDAMALVHTQRGLLREQLLRAAAHQFREGDVQHWWHPPVGRGVRTHFSDDYLWLPYATCHYVAAVGDTGVLDSEVPFLESRLLRPEEEANYDLPQRSAESGTLYEHCVRAIKNGLKFGEHGLPLMGCGDWNDGMNLIGEHGKGESVWLGFFLYDVLKRFAILAERRGEQLFARQCEENARTLLENIEKNAWDGRWYRRAYFDNGEPLGSASNEECQIDSLPQSWSVIARTGNAERSQEAMEEVSRRLVHRDARLIQLFDPPFDKSALEPGYIKGYAPGVRENGGQYTHAAIWTTMAFALAGDTARAWELFKLINPIFHTQTPKDVAQYKVEPYVLAADVYSVPPHTGRGGWTWYTGSAGWMYRLLTETMLGIEVVVDELRFSPRVPVDWKLFKLSYRFRETTYAITCLNVSGNWKAAPAISVDGSGLVRATLKLIDDRKEHNVEVKL